MQFTINNCDFNDGGMANVLNTKRIAREQNTIAFNI